VLTTIPTAGISKVSSLFEVEPQSVGILTMALPRLSRHSRAFAGLCAVVLGAPNADSAWVEWLACLRRESIDFKKSELRSNSRSRDWRPEPDVDIVAVGLICERLSHSQRADVRFRLHL